MARSEGAASEPRLIPRTILFGNPEKTMPRLSPDGTRLAYLAPVDGVLNVWVGTVGGEEFTPVTHDRDRGVRIYFWAEDNRHILYMQDVGGNENWRLYATDVQSGETRDLTPFENVRAQPVAQDQRHPTEFLVALNKDNVQFHDVYHLDLVSGELTQVATNPGNVVGWVADVDLRVRGALAALPDGGQDLLVREGQGQEDGWRPARHWEQEDSLTSGPVAIAADGRTFYLLDSQGANAGRLVGLDLASGEVSVIAGDHVYDVGGVVIDPETHAPQAVSFIKDRAVWTVLDPTVEADFAAIREIDRGDFSIVSRDRADATWLVAFVADDGPVSYYAFDRATKTARFLFVNQPDLAGYTLARMEPISFTARDGLEIHGYLTLPPGKGRTGLPLVLDVHGGPWGRDTWGYNPEAQWFANRGYASLQVNFRGSTGYGKDFVNAGDRQWGAKMHDDLVDAVHWAIAQGYADPKKVAIYGGSYGGYAALVGATFTPDLFCCAVDIVGPSNLVTLISTIPPYWKPMIAVFHKRVGNPETEAEFLLSRSPLSKVAAIKIPILIAQGANDPRVKQAESEQIVEAMKSKGLAYEYMLFPDEGHGFAKPENRLRFYAAAERFLARHLGGRVEEEARPSSS
jgi:dipeptidyl aminopeptidase/acylaminoacyl peptidase